MDDFDDSRLDDPEALQAADQLLRPIAEAGARVRREAAGAEEALSRLDDADRPRAVIAFGPEARLLRAVLEPTCPVPFMAWPRLGLPGWVVWCSPAVALVAALLAAAIWRFGVRHYRSTGS